MSEWVSESVTDMGRLWSDLGPIKILVIYLLFLLVGFPEMTTLDLKLKVAKLNKILAQVVQLDEEDGAVETDFWVFLF